ncbi:MAG: DUF4011 domain-containing protein [Dehalococcoidia bacterium]|nr:DUF4011 domain-containing protein [Dehalococcoidia bacterium]
MQNNQLASQQLTERQQRTAKVVADLRLRLLDLTNRNRLLNATFSDRSASHVRVIDELPDTLHQKLIDGKALSFRALPEPPDEPHDERSENFQKELDAARVSDIDYLEAMGQLQEDDDSSAKIARIERTLKDRVRQTLGLPPRPNRENRTPAEQAGFSGLDPSFDLPSTSTAGQKPGYADNLVQTLLYPDQLVRRLARIHQSVQTALSETGVNTLNAAFGYLEWYESDSSDQRLFAPLLLHPLVMERTLVNSEYKFKITSTGDDSDTNLTLRERLRRDFALELPELEEDETPEQYFARVDTLISSQKRWRVRRFVTIGIIAFDRLVMYQDLDPSNWPEDRSLDAHQILVELLAGADRSGSPFAQDYDVDLPQIASKVPLLITDADSSQFSAIVDVMDGKNLAIKGPPGTGKSQTITNIIAAALAQGKKVLFIAEKMAALEVVKSRLEHVGLGDFCLELHSTKTRKTEVINSLKKRLDKRPLPPPAALADAIKEQEQLRAQLTRYADLINQPFGATGKTLHDLFWAAVRARERKAELGLPVTLDTTLLEGANDFSSFYADRSRAALDALQKVTVPLSGEGSPEHSHPWAGVRAAGLSPFDQDEFVKALQDWKESLASVSALVEAGETNLGVARPMNAQDARAIIQVIDLLPNDTASAALEILPRLVGDSVRQDLWQFVGSVRRWDSINARVLEKMEAAPTLPPGDFAMLEARYRALDEKFPLAAIHVGQLPELADHYSDVEHQAQEQLPVITRLVELAHFESPPTGRKVRSLLGAVELLRSTPREVLRKRSPRLLDPSAHAILQQAKVVAHDLNERRTLLATRFSFRAGDNPQDYRSCATALRSAGRLRQFFNRDFKHAKSAWRSIYKGIDHVAIRDIAVGFDDIATYLESVGEFADDERLKSICGSEFYGLVTDFKSLLVVNRFAESVEERFAIGREGHPQVASFLLEAQYSQIEAVLGLVTEQVADAIETLLAAFEECKAVNRDTEMGQSIDHFRQSAHSARDLHRSLIDSRVKTDLRLENLTDLANDLQEAARLRSVIEGAGTAKSILGEKFHGVETDVRNLTATLELAETFGARGWSSALESPMLSKNLLAKHSALKTFARSLQDAMAAETAAQSAACAICDIAGTPFFSKTQITVETKAERIQRALEHTDDLPSWSEYCQLRASVEDLKLGTILEAYDALDASYVHLKEAFDFVFYQSLVRAAYKLHPELARFSGISQEEARRRFQEADRTIIKLRAGKLASDLSSSPISWGNNIGPKSTWTERYLINNEIPKRSKHIPLRDLLQRSGGAIQEMKPCWMMSPASVAQFIQPGGVQFDIIVIDEASQMKPEDALGATARGKQLIVVGDPQQLPPTSFFERTQATTLWDDDSVDTESILDLALNVFESPRDLRWHYRSRHQSLIAFSNAEFYKRELVVFPSPFKSGEAYGVSYRKVNGIYSPGSGINVIEAQAVADAAAAFMRDPNHTEKSLGIVAVNQAQRDLILEEMSRVYAGDPAAEAYRMRWEGTLEPTFVKNLESVQGDERDVIFISTVYGPDQLGGRVAQRFGPINSAAGHRRLNVLFTRAKEKVVVFSSMQASDVVPTETSKRGITVLKDYLSYAQYGSLSAGVASSRDPDSDFEEFVARRLKQQGFEVVTQVGVDGYFIDMALKDPRNTDRFLLGIECDGKTYHSAKSARDRDRLREEILNLKGWRLYRIWSTDWFSDPERETKKLIAYVRSLMEQPNSEARLANVVTQVDRIGLVAAPDKALSVPSEQASQPVLNPGQTEPITEDLESGNTRFSSLKAPQESQGKLPGTNSFEKGGSSSAHQVHLDDILRQRALQFIDNRSKGGALWVIGGRELDWLNVEFERLGAKFWYAPKGGQATQNKPGWFTRSKS